MKITQHISTVYAMYGLDVSQINCYKNNTIYFFCVIFNNNWKNFKTIYIYKSLCVCSKLELESWSIFVGILKLKETIELPIFDQHLNLYKPQAPLFYFHLLYIY